LINLQKKLGNSPKAVLQLTDIDPKIYQKDYCKTAKAKDISNRYFSYLIEDLNKIGIQDNFIYSRVSDFLLLIEKDVINILTLKKGYSYAGNVFLNISNSISSPFNISYNEILDMPIDISNGKNDQRDIVIWNADNFYIDYLNEGENLEGYYKTILTTGIPGWHFQDCEIIKYVLGGYYDIHGGAIELLYPHHEFIDEILNQTSNKHKIFLKKTWIHIGLVKIHSEKMSNSKGNTIFISDIIKKYSSNALKIFFLSKNYKHDIEFTIRDLERCEKMNEVIIIKFLEKKDSFEYDDYLKKQLLKNFLDLVDNDYDTESAIKFIFEILNKYDNPTSLIKEMLEILGLIY
jgi:cysteinyl-tRNA synthetase